MPPKRSVTVEVAGQRFTLKTDAEDDYVHALADFVTRKVKEAKAGSRAFSTHALAILAALQIADELFQTQSRAKDLKRDVTERSRSILALVEQALGGREPRSGPADADDADDAADDDAADGPPALAADG